jgi:hypothetical protein
MTTSDIARALSSLSLGPDVTFENLTMLPLLRQPSAAAPHNTPQDPAAPRRASRHRGRVSTPDYLVLDDALALGVVEITEVSEAGSVPNLRVRNKGPQPVLIIDGEELVGAKQNRVVNLSILVPAASDLTIPVSCVEAGRWRFRSKTFAAAPRAQYATGRAKKMAQVTASMLDAAARRPPRAAAGHDVGSFRSDQAEVWNDISAKSARLGVRSETSAMEDLFTVHETRIDRFVAACHPVEHQVGALFAVNGRVVGFDLFDRPETLQKVLPKLVRSVAIDALDAGQSLPASPAREAARLFLGIVADTPAHASKALGVGQDLRVTAPGVTAAALAASGGVVHLSAFAV